MANEPSIKESKAMKASNVMHGSGNRPHLDCINLTLINLDPLGRDDETQEHLKSEKGTLLAIPIKLLLSKNHHNLS